MDAPRSTALIFSLKVWFVSRLCVTAVLRQSEIRFVLIQAYNVQRLYLLQTPQEHYHGDMLTSGDTISENKFQKSGSTRSSSNSTFFMAN